MRLAFLAVMAIILSGCTPPQDLHTAPNPSAGKQVMALAPVGFGDVPGWNADHTGEALAAFVAGCAHMSGTLGGNGTAAALGGLAENWKQACDAAREVPKANEVLARAFFEKQFQAYAITGDGSDQGLFTGYYEPEVLGSRSPGSGYPAALLSKPNDLVQIDLSAFADDLKGRKLGGRLQSGSFVPYYDRSEIAAGALKGKRLELIWLANEIDAFFLEIQGSGRVRLPDGRVARVTYSAQNGRPYVPIGKVLADQGAIPLDQVSLQTIRAWLEGHPAEAQGVMNRNPSFVFFRELINTRADQGPPGALGAPLTPGRSIAVDRSYLPLGAPVFVDTTDAITGDKFQRLMVAQDLGGAIKGPVRADIFFGWGEDAEAHAGHMRQQGRQFLLLPKAASGN